MTWQDDAEALWGSEWRQPLSEVAGVASKTAIRWGKAGACPPQIERWLAETVASLPAGQHRAYGGALRAALWAHDGALDVLGRVQEDLEAARLP
ncbi:hypothetical protein [Azospirillum sp. B510]|uniref:hypothetical protein n=1 Tax=Azospirillum sp. (strain B510) TaxID=137722 RepID=UPI00031D8380|nr:hypothetical protein [Azospirillum sp. B510]